jgi:hypothetical protein
LPNDKAPGDILHPLTSTNALFCLGRSDGFHPGEKGVFVVRRVLIIFPVSLSYRNLSLFFCPGELAMFFS